MMRAWFCPRLHGPDLPPNEPTHKSSGPCPTCAEMGKRVEEFKKLLKIRQKQIDVYKATLAALAEKEK